MAAVVVMAVEQVVGKVVVVMIVVQALHVEIVKVVVVKDVEKVADLRSAAKVVDQNVVRVDKNLIEILVVKADVAMSAVKVVKSVRQDQQEENNVPRVIVQKVVQAVDQVTNLNRCCL